MNRNFGFRDVKKHFFKTNYAEQYLNDDGTPKDLSHLRDYFREEFVKENEETLTYLLQKGVVSTTMIRNLRNEGEDAVAEQRSVASLFNGLFDLSINTVEFPEKLYKINLDTCKIESIHWTHDILSPPCFLDLENSMGRYRDDLSKEDLEYGEAIVEIRGIRWVSNWFLRKCGRNPNDWGEFLKNTIYSINDDALALFSFLRNFGTEAHFVEIFHLGIPFAIQKYKMKERKETRNE